MTSRLQTLAFLPLLALAACDDPAALTGCDAPHGCEIEGVDLAILEADIRFDDGQPFENEVDAHVVEPGSELDLVVRIVNRGTEAAAPAVLRVRAPLFDPIGAAAIPALDPGEERTIRVDVTAPDLDMWGEMLYSLSVDIGTESTAWFDDADVDNNFAPAGSDLSFHPLVPVLRVEIELPDTVRALHPYIGSGVVTNLSPFVPANDLTFAICVYPGNPACDDHPDGPFSSTGTIAPGDSRLVPVGVYAPQEWGIDLNHPDYPVSLSACFASEEDWSTGRVCVAPSVETMLVANMDAICDHPVVEPPSTFESLDPAAACALGGEFGPMFFVHAFDALEGDEIRFTPTDSAAGANTILDVYDIEASEIPWGGLLDEPRVVTIPADGRYFVVTRVIIGTGGATILIEKL